MAIPIAASAKTARCRTTDDGSYPCQFRTTDKDGSFEIKAPGKPTFILNMSAPGVADGFMGSTALPGTYLRSTSDPACWLNSATKTSICVY